MLETAHSPHFGLLTKHGLSASAPGWARLWAVGVAVGVAGGHTWPGEHPVRWDLGSRTGRCSVGGCGKDFYQIFRNWHGGDKLRIQGWMLRKDFTKNRTIRASTSPGEETALAKSLGVKASAF